MYKKRFWHVTSVDVFDKILNEGLKLNVYGQLFLFDKPEFACKIALDQCGLLEYALLQVKNIDVSRLKPDKVAELTAQSQWIYDCPIPKENIKLVNVYTINFNMADSQ